MPFVVPDRLSRINVEQITTRLRTNEAKNAVTDYIDIMDRFHSIDVSKNPSFKTLFNGFYVVRLSETWHNTFFTYLETNRARTDISLSEVLRYLHTKTKRFEPALASNIVATINTKKPIWNDIVLTSWNIIAPPEPKGYNNKDEKVRIRIELTTLAYQDIVAKYADFLGSDVGKSWVEAFNIVWGNIETITNLKKIDLIFKELSRIKIL